MEGPVPTDQWFDSETIHKHYPKAVAITKAEARRLTEHSWKTVTSASPKGVIFYVTSGQKPHDFQVPGEQDKADAMRLNGDVLTTSRRSGQPAQGWANGIIQESHVPAHVLFCSSALQNKRKSLLLDAVPLETRRAEEYFLDARKISWMVKIQSFGFQCCMLTIIPSSSNSLGNKLWFCSPLNSAILHHPRTCY